MWCFILICKVLTAHAGHHVLPARLAELCGTSIPAIPAIPATLRMRLQAESCLFNLGMPRSW